MTALLDELHRSGLRVWLDGESLRVGPRNLLTPDLRQRIAAGRDALLVALTTPEEEIPPYPWPADLGREDVWGRFRLLDLSRPLPLVTADEDLAGWFTLALDTGRLPAEPFELAPAVTVADPVRLYAWVLERVERPGNEAEVREAERLIRTLRRMVEGGA